MEVPHQYPYNPPAWLILLSFGSGFLWIAPDWLRWGHLVWSRLFGLIPIAWALIFAVRRIWVEHYLLLDNDRIRLLPIGMFQTGTARIEYASIRRVWRHYMVYTFVLKVATEEQGFKILPAFLPDLARAIAIWKTSLTESF